MKQIKHKVDFVFNVFNEIESLEIDISEITNLSKSFDYIDKIIIVEDGSIDGSSEKLRELKNIYNFDLLQSNQRRGYTKALINGLEATSADYIFFSDFGGKFDWQDIKKVLSCIPEYDLVIGVRKGRKDPIYRRLLTRLYSFYILIFFGIKTRDPDSGFRLYSRQLVQKLLNEKIINSHLLNSEFTIKSIIYGFRYKEVDIKYFSRKGKSRGLPLKIIPKVVFTIIKNSFKLKKEVKINV
jgi:hypothetical protein